MNQHHAHALPPDARQDNGVGIPLIAMREPEKARGRAPVN